MQRHSDRSEGVSGNLPYEVHESQGSSGDGSRFLLFVGVSCQSAVDTGQARKGAHRPRATLPHSRTNASVCPIYRSSYLG